MTRMNKVIYIVILLIVILLVGIVSCLVSLEFTQQRLDKFERRRDDILLQFKGKTVPSIIVHKTDRIVIYGAKGDIVVEVGEEQQQIDKEKKNAKGN